MEHHASLLAKWLTQVLGLSQHAWPGFAHGMPLSVLERYDPVSYTHLTLPTN